MKNFLLVMRVAFVLIVAVPACKPPDDSALRGNEGGAAISDVSLPLSMSYVPKGDRGIYYIDFASLRPEVDSSGRTSGGWRLPSKASSFQGPAGGAYIKTGEPIRLQFELRFEPVGSIGTDTSTGLVIGTDTGTGLVIGTDTVTSFVIGTDTGTGFVVGTSTGAGTGTDTSSRIDNGEFGPSTATEGKVCGGERWNVGGVELKATDRVQIVCDPALRSLMQQSSVSTGTGIQTYIVAATGTHSATDTDSDTMAFTGSATATGTFTATSTAIWTSTWTATSTAFGSLDGSQSAPVDSYGGDPSYTPSPDDGMDGI